MDTHGASKSSPDVPNSYPRILLHEILKAFEKSRFYGDGLLFQNECSQFYPSRIHCYQSGQKIPKSKNLGPL